MDMSREALIAEILANVLDVVKVFKAVNNGIIQPCNWAMLLTDMSQRLTFQLTKRHLQYNFVIHNLNEEFTIHDMRGQVVYESLIPSEPTRSSSHPYLISCPQYYRRCII
ncbi:uncharacterized protein LOC118435688 [Folsomia candida]|uniref:uncharacterized protein LOC118435688 n=1 Tax=Folsomia candida TaxID=158441 RepID=UPI0016053AA4|nr:uncharacterized protein LOC118435688 [Folsomia candida]